MSYEAMTFVKEDGVAVMTLNRPEKLNAINPTMWFELARATEEAQNDEEVRVLVLTGTGRGFCAGADVFESLTLALSGEAPPRTREQLKEPVGVAGWRLAKMRKPTIAAVNGVAAGAGFALALACDIRIASETARFTNAFVRMGLVPDNGMTYFLSRLVGPARALEMMYTCETIDAPEAARIGMVNRVVPADDLMTVSLDLARKIAEGAPMAVEMTKFTAARAQHCDLDELIEIETYAQKVCMDTEDFKEGIAAFMEKRPPVFKGL